VVLTPPEEALIHEMTHKNLFDAVRGLVDSMKDVWDQKGEEFLSY
jgi:hypothetical protein